MLLFAVGGLASCASAQAPEAREAAEQFLSRASSDAASACELLAPDTFDRVAAEGDGECPAGLQQADLKGPSAVEGVVVAGNSAQVRTADGVVFLALFADGWRVTAAGCTRTSDDAAVPYDCEVQD